MANLKRRAERFALLSSIQSAEVVRAANHYSASRRGLERANDKLQGLEEYLSSEQGLISSTTSEMTTSIGLAEISVFTQRLHHAISAQRDVCNQLAVQSDAARSLLVQAEMKRAGMDRARITSARRLLAEQMKKEQRHTEDTLMARYGGLRP